MHKMKFPSFAVALGVKAPPRSVENFSKKELVALVKKLLGM